MKWFGLLVLLLLLAPVAVMDVHAGWDLAAQDIMRQIQNKPVNFKRLTPVLLFDNTGSPAEEALSKVLTDTGYTLATTGSFPRVVLTEARQIHNRFWQRPWQGHLIRIHVRDEGQLKNAFTGTHIRFDESFFQIPVRMFLLLLTAVLLWWFLQRSSLYNRPIAWGAAFFIWLGVGLFLGQGYFIWRVWM